MTQRGLKVLLAASVALNLFAIAGGTAFAISRAGVDERVQEQRRPTREGGFRQVTAQLEQPVRRQVRSSLRDAALEARPDFEAARQARREAVEAAGQAELNVEQVTSLLEQSRSSEMRGRARIEGATIALLSDLKLEDRKLVAGLLARGGPGGQPGQRTGRSGRNTGAGATGATNDPPPGPDVMEPPTGGPPGPGGPDEPQ